MEEKLGESSPAEILNFSISSPSKVSTSVSVTVTCGSYTIVNNTFLVAAKLMDNPPTVDELLTLITPSDMGSLLTVEEIESHSEEEFILVPEEDAVQDDEYYLSMINFEFEDVQFLVPRWRFPENSMLNLLPDQETCTSTWDGVSAQDFRHLMEFIYPFDSSPLPTPHWVSVLKLSSIWHMYEYRKQALSLCNFHGLDPEEKLVLGRLCGIPEWYREGCIELARGSSPLDASHEATIGIDAMVKISRARDAAYRDTVLAYHKQSPDLASFANEVPDRFVAEDNSSTTGSSVIDDICTARANGLSKWLRCCYERLIDREESITLEEVATLGLETTIGIWKARLRLFEEYRHILKSTSDLSFSTHIEAEFATELEEIRRLKDIFGPGPSISMPMGYFDPRSTYVFINLKFNSVLGIDRDNDVVSDSYNGAASQTVGSICVSSTCGWLTNVQWKFERTDSSYKILNASKNLYLSKRGAPKYYPLKCSKAPGTFSVGRASSDGDGSDIYGIFLSEFPEPTATAVGIKKEGFLFVSLNPWNCEKIEGSKWKIVTVDEAEKHFRATRT